MSNTVSGCAGKGRAPLIVEALLYHSCKHRTDVFQHQTLIPSLSSDSVSPGSESSTLQSRMNQVLKSFRNGDFSSAILREFSSIKTAWMNLVSYTSEHPDEALEDQDYGHSKKVDFFSNSLQLLGTIAKADQLLELYEYQPQV